MKSEPLRKSLSLLYHGTVIALQYDAYHMKNNHHLVLKTSVSYLSLKRKLEIYWLLVYFNNILIKKTYCYAFFKHKIPF